MAELYNPYRGTGGGTTIPAGFIMPSGLAAAPAGWLACDGAEHSRTTYSTLFAGIGTTYGAGDGSSTFNVPDFANKVPIGAGGDASLGASIGNSTAGVGGSGHQHGFDPGQTATVSTDITAGSVTVPIASSLTSLNDSGGTVNNYQPSLGVNYFIKT